MERINGTVTRVILTRGFGFILGDDGLERFMHIDHVIPKEEWERMSAGRRVSFIPARTERGLRAHEVRPS